MWQLLGKICILGRYLKLNKQSLKTNFAYIEALWWTSMRHGMYKRKLQDKWQKELKWGFKKIELVFAHKQNPLFMECTLTQLCPRQKTNCRINAGYVCT